MRLDGIRTGDIIEVNRLGRRFHALVSGTDSEGLEILPLDRRVTYRTCRAQQVVAHWSRRGRVRASGEQALPSEGAPEATPAASTQATPAPGPEQAPAPAPLQLQLRAAPADERQSAQVWSSQGVSGV